MVAVTFDDGPKDYPSSYTLDALRKIGARGTYFTVGKQLERYGYVLQKQYDQNHIFGTHTFHHWGGGSFKSDASRLKEIALSAEWTLPLVGEEASLFRAPGGTYPTWVKAGVPMPIIQWSVDTYDYTGQKRRAHLLHLPRQGHRGRHHPLLIRANISMNPFPCGANTTCWRAASCL